MKPNTVKLPAKKGQSAISMPESLPSKDPSEPINVKRGSVTYASDVVLLVIFYLVTIITALLFSGRYDTHTTDKIPWIGESNATTIVMNRLQTVETDIESALKSEKWQTLGPLVNMSIDILRTDSLDWPIYVRLATLVQMKPARIFSDYLPDKLDATLLRTDHFHVSLQSLFTPEPDAQFPGNIIGIFKKVSQPLLKVMTLRESSAALIEKSQSQDMSINTINMKYKGKIDGVVADKFEVTKIPEGSQILASVTVNVVAKKPTVVKEAVALDAPDSFLDKMLSSIYQSLRTCDELLDMLIEACTRYKKTTADGLIYFIPFQGDTLMMMVIRMDPKIVLNQGIEQFLLRHYGYSSLTAITRIAQDDLED